MLQWTCVQSKVPVCHDHERDWIRDSIESGIAASRSDIQDVSLPPRSYISICLSSPDVVKGSTVALHGRNLSIRWTSPSKIYDVYPNPWSNPRSVISSGRAFMNTTVLICECGRLRRFALCTVIVDDPGCGELWMGTAQL